MLRILATLLALVLPVGALAEEAPDAMVKRVADEVVAIIKSDKDMQAGNTAKVVELAEQKVLPHFDFERMTRLAVGRNWAQATDAQKQALIKEFRTLLVRTYSISLSQYRNQTIEVKPARVGAQDKDAVVRTAVIQQGGPPIPIDYSMERAESGWKVYDVVIDGASLVTTYRGTFNDQVQRGGLDGLIKALQERNRSPEPTKAPANELTFATIPGVLAQSAEYEARTDLPDRLVIDFVGVSGVDSAAVALLIEWRRQALLRGKTIVFTNLPANLVALARLYGVADLIQTPVV